MLMRPGRDDLDRAAPAAGVADLKIIGAVARPPVVNRDRHAKDRGEEPLRQSLIRVLGREVSCAVPASAWPAHAVAVPNAFFLCCANEQPVSGNRLPGRRYT